MHCGQYKLTPQSFMPTLAATFVQTITFIGQTHDHEEINSVICPLLIF